LGGSCLFAGNETGDQTSAIFYSLIESAMHHNLNIADFFEDVIRRLPSSFTPATLDHELLP